MSWQGGDGGKEHGAKAQGSTARHVLLPEPEGARSPATFPPLKGPTGFLTAEKGCPEDKEEGGIIITSCTLNLKFISE